LTREANSAKEGNKGEQQATQCIFVCTYVKFIVRSHPFLRPLQKAVIVDIASNGFEVTGAPAHLGSCAGCSKDKREGPLKPKKLEQGGGRGNAHFSL